ncbi:MAG: methyltransferase domain-containing protein [Saprospiraceae bacterium]|nr:methyltransferase domain-containing protein [Lewinella sp.]
MQNKTWLPELVSPTSGQPLHLREKEQEMISADGSESFPVIDGVPQLLPITADKVISQSEAHVKLGTDFDYREHYQKDAEIFDYFLAYEDGASRHEARRLHEAIAAQVASSVRNILDVGCGNAWVAGHFCRKGISVTSLDIAQRNPAKALETYPFENHTAVVADVYTLPFRPESFDCIIASEIIEHVADPRLFIQRLVEVLRPGGQLILTTPFDEKIAYSLCIHCNRPTPQHAHIHSFTKDSLAQLVRREHAAELRIKTFSNKALTKLQTHVLLQYLPYPLWKITDNLANMLVNKPARLMMKVVKKSAVDSQ